MTSISGKIPAYVLSTHTVGLGVIRSLGEHDIPIVSVCYDEMDMGHFSKYVTKSYFTGDPRTEELDFINGLKAIARENGEGILFPCDDATVLAVSNFREELSDFFILDSREWSVKERLLNKREMYKLAESNGIPIPRTITLDSIENVEKVRELKFPLIIKPVFSHKYVDALDRKLTMVFTSDELKAEIDRAERLGLEVMVQEYIPGDDAEGINYNVLFIDGAPLKCMTSRKMRMMPREFGVPAVVRKCKDVSEVRDSVDSLLKNVNYEGYVCAEFKNDKRTGTYKLMEINPRFNRSIYLSTRCGINFPALYYFSFFNRKKMVSMARESKQIKGDTYWVDEFKDLHYILKYKGIGFVSKSFLTPYFQSRVFSVFSIGDIVPFIMRVFKLIRSGIKKFASRLHHSRHEG